MVSLSFLIYLLAVLLLTATMLVISHLLNPKVKRREDPLPFESGIVPAGNTDIRWTVNYFLVAILFVIFDMEAVFLYVWSIVVMDTGWPAFIATTVFIGILLIALVYEWRMGVLEWGNKVNKYEFGTTKNRHRKQHNAEDGLTAIEEKAHALETH